MHTKPNYLIQAILLCLAITFPLLGFGQKKIVLKHGLQSKKIKIGKTIGVTEKGAPFEYGSWEFYCSGCPDSVCRSNIWTVDTIRQDYIVLRQFIKHDSAYQFDTITYSDRKKYLLYLKEWHWVGEIPSADSNMLHNRLVFKYPILYTRKKVYLDSVTSFSFAKSDNCSGYDLGVPLAALFLIVGSPIAAAEDGDFNAGVFAVGETLGLLIVYSMYKNSKDRQVLTYNLDKWKIRVR